MGLFHKKEEENLQVINKKILEHINKHQSKADILNKPFLSPKELTQKGISEALGIDKTKVLIYLRALKIHGHIVVYDAYVKGIRRKGTVYVLTPKGSAYLKSISEQH